MHDPMQGLILSVEKYLNEKVCLQFTRYIYETEQTKVQCLCASVDAAKNDMYI